MADLIQLAFNGVLFGTILALGAIGLTLVYGIIRLANFAHGDIITWGAYIPWALVVLVAAGTANGLALVVGIGALAFAGLDHFVFGVLWGMERLVVAGAGAGIAIAGVLGATLVSATLVGMLAVGIGGVALEGGIFRPLRRRGAGLFGLMIASIGVALMLRNLAQITFGPDLQSFKIAARRSTPRLGGLFEATDLQLTILALGLVAVTATYLLLTRTKIGTAMRALADNVDLAKASGIDTGRVILHVWLLGGALAALAGTLFALYTSVHINLGWFLLLPLFAAVILGGIGSAEGAMLGGLLIGVAQEMSVAVLDPGYRNAVGFAVLIVVLLVRPRGIRGVSV